MLGDDGGMGGDEMGLGEVVWCGKRCGEVWCVMCLVWCDTCDVTAYSHANVNDLI